MTNRVVDGFAHYGTCTFGVDTGGAVKSALLAGAYAELTATSYGIVQLPWDLSNPDLYFAVMSDNSGTGLRRVLPASYNPVFLSAYFALDKLPSANKSSAVFDFRDVSNNRIVAVYVNSTGAIAVGDPSTGTELAVTSGPVIVPETATHIEIKVTPAAGAASAIQVYASGTKVIDASGLTFTNSGAVAQIALGRPVSVANSYTMYFSNLIIRDSAGTVNNAIMGDRRVATLLVDSIDAGHQGWTKRPLHRFGVGILDLTPTSLGAGSAVYSGTSAETDLGSVDYTIEGQVRFRTLPTGSNMAHIYGKWDENANARSFQLALCGPSLNNGNLIFRISTDGKAGTVNTLLSMPWTPIVGHWYHWAVERIAGVTSYYIDGVKLGLGVADANFYYNGTGRAVIGTQLNTTTAVVGTHFDGWHDEMRVTKGSYRYGGNFAPPTDVFPRGSLADPMWSDVYWLSGWDSASIADDSGYARPLTAINGAAAITPGDGGDAYQVLNKTAPNDNTFIEASLLAAQATYTQNTAALNNDTVTINGHVYTFKTALTGAADEVLIGASPDASCANLNAAIIAGPGSGTLYGAGTVANADVTSVKLPSTQVQVTAQTAGAAGNAITVSTTSAGGTWGGGVVHLSGGADIPAYSQFGFHNIPAGASLVDSLTIVRRSWKSDSGLETSRASLVGIGGGVLTGASINDTTVPVLYHDTFEFDPDNPANPLSPTSANAALIRIDRTV